MAISPSIVQQVKPPRGKDNKGSTPSTRKHRFQPFSQRIQNLKIEPVRRARRYNFDEAQTSYFHDAFFRWKEANLSETFSTFANEVAPLCDSLPQIIHYQNRILDLLVEYLEKHDALALEPLLDLTAQFAHDLGERFEQYFERILSVVVNIAARHESIEAIEWSFNCLAWLFKYLSRLLVPDLRPLFDWLAPLLGKQQQKHFVPTFAAEALSFLVRKAAQKYHKDEEPLRLVVGHILKDAENFSTETAAAPRYFYGLMTLFAETMKSVQHGTHSGAETVLKELIHGTLAAKESHQDDQVANTTASEDILYGVTTHMLHSTLRETFAPLLSVILHQFSLDDHASSAKLAILSRVLLVVVGVRKASRIQDWRTLMDKVAGLVDIVHRKAAALDQSTLSDALACLAVVMHSCPLDIVLHHVRLLDKVGEEHLAAHFLPFCDLFSKIDPARFKDFVLPRLQKFIVQQWEAHGESLCLFLPRLYSSGRLAKSSLSCPSQWQSSMRTSFKLDDTVSDAQLFVYNAWLLIAENTKVEEELQKSMVTKTYPRLKSTLASPTTSLQNPRDRFLTGKAFQYITTQSLDALQQGDWPQIVEATTRFSKSEAFWQAVLRFLRQHRSRLELETPPPIFMDNLCSCLASPAHELRLLALEIVALIVPDGPMTDAIAIETSPLDLQNARNISHRIHLLGSRYKDHLANPWLMHAIPSYLMGIMHLRLSQAWDDAVNAIREVCASKEGEQIVSDIAFTWLEQAPAIDTMNDFEVDTDGEPPKATNHFQCFNFLHIQWMISGSQKLDQNPEDGLSQLFREHNRIFELQNPECRNQALKVLNGIPAVAEKRNRTLVPILLRWASSNGVVGTGEESARWNRKDQKALLSLFARFLNPRVLYESDSVYSALLTLLTNADLEMQRSALKGILAWKQPEVTRYEEDLTKLLDDKTFRDQLSIFLGFDDDRSVRPEDRSFVTPLILRILYGKIILREGSASGKQGQESRRKAVFTALSRSGDDELMRNEFHQFLTITLARLDGVSVVNADGVDEDQLQRVSVLMEPRKQFGFLNMLTDLLETLRSDVEPFSPRLIDPVLCCLFSASRQSSLQDHDMPDAGESDEHDDRHSNPGLQKTIRQAGLRCLNLLLNHSISVDWTPYVRAITEELVRPRLAQFASENSQSISGVMRLFSTWASSPRLAMFLDYETQGITILGQLSKCITEPSTKTEVKIFIINEVWRKLIASIDLSDDTDPNICDRIKTQVVQPHVNEVLLQLTQLLRETPAKELLDAAVSCVADIAPFVVSSEESWSMVQVSTILLREPARRVSPKTKHDILRSLKILVPQCSGEDFAALLSVIASLFEYFRDRENRVLLSEVLEKLAGTDKMWLKLASLCADLNSFDTMRLDEPDYDRRNQAFRFLLEDPQMTKFDLVHWKPIVYNYLYYLNDLENFSIRLDSSAGLRRFLNVCATEEAFDRDEVCKFLETAMLPSIQKGLKDAPELVRAEHLSVLAQIIRSFPDWPTVANMQALLAGNDEEASFFTNVLHIHHHRRLRALRRLANEAATGNLSHTSISRLLVPLLEHFVLDQGADETAHNLANEAINSIGVLVQWLQWQQFKPLLKRYIDFLGTKVGLEKTTIKLIAAVVDGLRQSCRAAGFLTDSLEVTTSSEQTVPMEVDHVKSTLATTIPSHQALCADLTANAIPILTKFVHSKGDTEENLRIPVAVSLIKILQILPSEDFNVRLPGVLLDTCQILRSRSQDVRDLTRKTLAEMARLLGPPCFGFLLKELGTALPRGYQLHVLSFTVHSLLVTMIDTLGPGQLDYCLPPLIAVVMDDIFGVTGQEKDAEDYISRMKEVKSQKSYDTAELISRVASPSHLIDVIRPIDILLREKLDLRLVRKIDELLRRIELGISQNIASNDRKLLQLCYEIIQEAASSDAQGSVPSKQESNKLRRYLVNLKSASKSGNKGATSSYAYKSTCFGMNLLRSVLKRYDNLQTPENIAMFIPIIGDSLLSGHEEVQLAAVKLLGRVIRTPMPALDENGPVYISTAHTIIKNAPNTHTELAQAALKLISSILRDRPALATREVKRTQLAFLLSHLKPDLREPDRQGVAFNFIRAILTRNIVLPEVYEIMDTDMITIMITNQTPAIRDHARGVYVQFLLAYPQTKNRFQKQISRILKNLSYEHAEGRRSVLECLNDLLNKMDNDLLEEVLMPMFLALSLTIVNDEATDCKEMAKQLAGKVFGKANDDTLTELLSLVKKYLNADTQPALRSLGIQLYTIYVGARQGELKDLKTFIEGLEEILQEVGRAGGNSEWELLFRSLRAVSSLCQHSPAAVLVPKSGQLWSSIFPCLAYPHTWVKEAAAQALQHCLTDLARHNKDNGFSHLPLIATHGLELGSEQMIQITRSCLKNLRMAELREEFAMLTVKNLSFMTRVLAANDIQWPRQANAIHSEEDPEAADDSSASEDEQDEASDQPKKGPIPAAAHVLSSLAFVLRRPLPPGTSDKPPSLVAKSSALTLLASLAKSLPLDVITPSLSRIVRPLLIFTSPSTTHPSFPYQQTWTDAYKAYRSNVQEAIDIIREKLGDIAFAELARAVEKDIREEREQRGIKRRMDRVREPAIEEARKRRKREKERGKKRERNLVSRKRSRA